MPTIGRRLMSMLPTRDHSPEAMTPRARAYLAVVTVRHLLVGGVFLLLGGSMPPAPYRAFADPAPLAMWGSAALVVGTVALVSVAWRSERWARFALIISATLTSLMALALILSLFDLTAMGALLTILLASFTAKDMIVSQDPIRSPFERLLRSRGAHQGD